MAKRARAADPLTEIAKRRQQEQALLANELEKLDQQINTLTLRRQLVMSLLDASAPSAEAVVARENLGVGTNGSETYKKCADCGALVTDPAALVRVMRAGSAGGGQGRFDEGG